jgi:hypothetical protein
MSPPPRANVDVSPHRQHSQRLTNRVAFFIDNDSGIIQYWCVISKREESLPSLILKQPPLITLRVSPTRRI